jgi:hypothetical protein
VSNATVWVGFGLCATLLAGLLTLVVVVAITRARRERERTAGLAAWARANGWGFLTRPGTNWPQRLPGHHRRGVTLALTGVVNERLVSVGEYHYTESSTVGETSSTNTYRYVVVGLRLPTAYPSIAVAPRGGLSRLGRTLFGDGRATTGHPAFDGRFRIATADPALIPALIGPALIGAHLAEQVPPWSIVGDELLTYFPGTLRDPAAIPGYAAWLGQVADLLGR